jgi:hypothetical protein
MKKQQGNQEVLGTEEDVIDSLEFFKDCVLSIDKEEKH